MISETTEIRIAVLRTEMTGNPGAGVAVDGMGVLVEVGVEVGQGVMVGSLVGVPVGWVGVGVLAARMVSL